MEILITIKADKEGKPFEFAPQVLVHPRKIEKSTPRKTVKPLTS